MEAPAFSAIVLAAGKGTRMNSPLPKVMHPVAGRPMIQSVIESLRCEPCAEVRVVLGHGIDLIRPLVEQLGGLVYVQENAKGTADAVASAEVGSLSGTVVIVNGDHPLIETADILQLLNEHDRSDHMLSVVTAELEDPGHYGRIVREHGRLRAIVEAKDCGPESLKIKEINTGIYICHADELQAGLSRIDNNNAKGEYYLTDLVEVIREMDKPVGALPAPAHLAFGVNTQMELAVATRQVYRRRAEELMAAGVIVVDPDHVYIDAQAEVGPGTLLHPGVHLRGRVRLGPGCVIGVNSVIQDSELAAGVEVKTGTIIESTRVESNAALGPYARLRPGTEIGAGAQVGNFVELKNTQFGPGSKANHLSYLGDATVGSETNIGCGTITCNYAVDRKKYRTEIGSGVFVGSDSQFVAPVKVGDGAVIGSGSTITKEVPAQALAVGRARQVIKPNYRAKKPAE